MFLRCRTCIQTLGRRYWTSSHWATHKGSFQAANVEIFDLMHSMQCWLPRSKIFLLVLYSFIIVLTRVIKVLFFVSTTPVCWRVYVTNTSCLILISSQCSWKCTLYFFVIVTSNFLILQSNSFLCLLGKSLE